MVPPWNTHGILPGIATLSDGDYKRKREDRVKNRTISQDQITGQLPKAVYAPKADVYCLHLLLLVAHHSHTAPETPSLQGQDCQHKHCMTTLL